VLTPMGGIPPMQFLCPMCIASHILINDRVRRNDIGPRNWIGGIPP
jgi:hypothetical protein